MSTDLFINQKNFHKLNSYFLENYKKFLLKSFSENKEEGKETERLTLNLKPDFRGESFPPFSFLPIKLLDFVKFSHFLKKWLNIWFRIKFSDIPYCIFLPYQHDVVCLIENNNSPEKLKINCCHYCKYQNLCGGIHKAYLQKYGEKEFRAIPDVPYEIMIEVEPRCNLNCQACFNRNSFARMDRSLSPSLETSLLKEIIDEIARLKIRRIRFTGGEPLLRPDIYDLLDYAKSKGLRVDLNSNGILIDEIAAKKLNGLINSILISFQGMGKIGDEAVGKEGATQLKIKALLNLKKFTKTEVVIATVLGPKIIGKDSNPDELDKIYKLIKDIGCVSRWHLCRRIVEDKESYYENGEDYKKIVNKLIDWQLGKKNFRFHHYPYVISNGIPFCFYDMDRVDLVSYGAFFVDGHKRLSIDPMGNIKPIYYSPLILSNDPRNILAAWNHPFLKDLRNLKFLPVACSDCFYKRKCLGGSRFLANLVGGSYAAPDPLMPIE
jgi:MoaA/NifB/PqqE/SkfB family radical SAM enzyme